MSAGWIAVTAVVLLLLVPAGYLLGRSVWTRVEPGDEDPGGKESPPPQLDPNLWAGTPFVEVLRQSRRLKDSGRRKTPKAKP